MFFIKKAFNQPLIHALLFWLCVATVSALSGFVGAGLRIDATSRSMAQPENEQRTIVLEDRSRGADEEQHDVARVLENIGQSMVLLYNWKQPNMPDVSPEVL